MRSKSLAAVLLTVLVPVSVLSSAAAAEDPFGYQTPSPVLVDLVDRPPTPELEVGPGGRWALLLEQSSLPGIAELAEPELRLGGLRVHPDNNGPSRRRTYSGLSFLDLADGKVRAVRGLPESPRLDDFVVSPDGRFVAFTHAGETAVELWLAAVGTAEAHRLGDVALSLAALHRPRWLPDSSGLVAALVPEERGPAPRRSPVPRGPVVQEHEGGEAPARTYQDLLQDHHDEALFHHYFTAQLARVGLGGAATSLGEPGIVWSYDPSPDGRYLLVETLHEPFSYLVPAFRFPRRIEVWDAAGEPLHRVADLPLQENVPIGYDNVPTGARDVAWRADAPSTLAWVEATDGGDARVDAEHHDQLFLHAAPFAGEPRAWTRLEHRLLQVYWSRDDLALVVERWRKTRRLKTLRVFPGDPARAAEVVSDRSYEDRYDDPGEPLTVRDARGREVLRTSGETLYLVGDGASPEGDRPFLDAFDLGSGTSRRLLRSEAPFYERPVEVLDAAAGQVLVSRETADEPPDYFVRDLASGELRRLTDFPHPAPELQGVTKELLRYPRADGVELTATLYLPPGWDAERDGPLPMLMWAYPREFKSASAAAQVVGSPYRFARLRPTSPLLFLALGYAILDNPTMPIVGEGDLEPNDHFREQLVASAEAAVAEVVRRGVTEPGRIAIGGHSYGAFMTANLLAHTDLFATGIARSGAYNRTLTPFGFQAEQRTYWQAPEVYFAMSPFMHAEKVNEPILLIHGAADNNAGTFPMQSERYYNALKGHGATVRLVMLPHESHGYRARESVLHVLWETERWLDRTLSSSSPRPRRSTTAATRPRHPAAGRP